MKQNHDTTVVPLGQRTLTVCILGLLFGCSLFAQTITLIDFGASASGNRFGLAGWNTVLLSPAMRYTATGPGGVVLQAVPDEYSDYMGVRGTAHVFVPGERIVVTWYNNHHEPITFTARISFSDADRPNGGTSSGPWYTMRSFEDYRITYTTIAPHTTAQTVFNITDKGVHKCDGAHSLVNINLHCEWFETWPKPYLVCDKIELMSDADIIPPDPPTGLTAHALSDSKIALQWQAPNDNVGVAEYLVYLDGEVEGYTREPNYTAVFLEPGRIYSFSVTALDRCRNESTKSAPVTCATLAYSHPPTLLNPAGLEYKGAFRLPETFAWGGEAMAYYPHGDGGQSGAGAADGYAGSLFVTNTNQREHGFVGEVSIPAPVMLASKDIAALPEAQVLKNPVNIRPANVNGWGDYVDIWRTGLTYVAEEDRLYSVWSVHFSVSGEKHACVSCCNASTLSGTKYGAWYIGHPASPPIDAMVGDYFFTVPQSWAAAHTSGRYLVAGRCRDGGLSGLGPTFYAISPVAGSPPAANTVLPYTTLLEYGPVEGADMYHLTEAIDGYRFSDSWRDAAWISTQNQHSIVIMGNKARGDHWYGYMGERMPQQWVIADVPYPDFSTTDPLDKSWKSHNFIPMAIFYDPADLARVASGSIASHQPQPYAAKRFDPTIFYGADQEIRSISYDAQNRRLYVLEFIEFYGSAIVHVWTVNEVTTSVNERAPQAPQGFLLRPNYPNPFNAVTKISYALPAETRVVIDIFDVNGTKIMRLLDEPRLAGWHEEMVMLDKQPSGVYWYRIKAGGWQHVSKMVLVR